MRTIGLLGGMSWESTVPYYQIINRRVAERLGGLHSARIVLYSVDFHDIEVLQSAGEWDRAGELLVHAAGALERAGADFLVLCTNTMHKLVPAIEAGTDLPVLHIADATAQVIRGAGLRQVGLLGTRFTMEQGFYRDRLERQHDIEVMTPADDDRVELHRIIYEELCLGRVNPLSRERCRGIVRELSARGAEGVILGCTEIGLLLGPQDVSVPLFDTTRIHAEAAALHALGVERA